jgi:hypothetical protein
MRDPFGVLPGPAPNKEISLVLVVLGIKLPYFNNQIIHGNKLLIMISIKLQSIGFNLHHTV